MTRRETPRILPPCGSAHASRGAPAPPRCFSDGPAPRPTHRTEAGAPTRIKTKPTSNPKPDTNPQTRPPIQHTTAESGGSGGPAAMPFCQTSSPPTHRTEAGAPTRIKTKPTSNPNPDTNPQTQPPIQPKPPNPVGAAASPRCFSDGPASRQPVAPRSVLPPESKSNPHQTQSQTPIHKPSRPSSLNRRTQWERRPRRDAFLMDPHPAQPIAPRPVLPPNLVGAAASPRCP